MVRGGGRVRGAVNPRTSLALLDEDKKGVHSVDTLGGDQRVSIVEPVEVTHGAIR